jgi:SAM-dependent methyltransferase
LRGIEDHLEAEFGKANEGHFEWQTRHSVVGRQEAQLVRRAFAPLGARVLDLGCAEGATLRHLGAEGAVGVDLFEDKLAFARANVPRCTFVKASAYALPFEDGSFDHVIIRDVLHHVEEPRRALREVARVIERGGRIDVLEPCRNNPLVLAHALTNPAERGELRSSARTLRRLLSDSFVVTEVEPLQALPLHRVVFHPRFGAPALGTSRMAVRAVAWAESIASVLMPRIAWAYVRVRAIKG